MYEGDWGVSCLELQGILEDRHRVKPEKHMVPIGNQMGRHPFISKIGLGPRIPLSTLVNSTPNSLQMEFRLDPWQGYRDGKCIEWEQCSRGKSQL